MPRFGQLQTGWRVGMASRSSTCSFGESRSVGCCGSSSTVPAPREARLEGTPGLPEDAISIADCRRVSGDVSAILDAEDTVDQTYILEVSSPGLDRPLRHLGDYRRFAGRLAKIVTSEAIDVQTYVAGRITGVEDDVVVIETGPRTCRIPLSLITRGRLEVDF